MTRILTWGRALRPTYPWDLFPSPAAMRPGLANLRAHQRRVRQLPEAFREKVADRRRVVLAICCAPPPKAERGWLSRR